MDDKTENRECEVGSGKKQNKHPGHKIAGNYIK